MTDGIIQEVIRQYLPSIHGKEYDVLKAIERKLIEKIKQEWYWENNSKSNKINLEKLIGDNQE